MDSRYLATIVILAVFIRTGETGTLPENPRDLREVSSANRQFSSKTFQVVARHDNNIIYSPMSASVVLSMAMFGARNETQSMMRSVLALPTSDATVKKGFESLIETLNSMKKVELRLANKIFTRTGLDVKPEFKEITATNFKSELEMVDFNNVQAASQIIDSWCQAQTNNRIKDIVKPDDLQGNRTYMVLLNAVYFKGQWEQKFSPEMTFEEPFFLDEKNQRNIPMMHITSRFNHGTIEKLNAEFVELRYASGNEDNEISMMIIVPKTVSGLKTAKNDFDKLDFSQLSDSGSMTEFKLSLPKFKIENTIDMKPVLEEMGMGIVFTDNANFSGISGNVPVKISKIVQKAFIEVDEEGSEAIGATEVIFDRIVGGYDPILQVNRPFIYAILHKPTRTVLFQGHFTTPDY